VNAMCPLYQLIWGVALPWRWGYGLGLTRTTCPEFSYDVGHPG
jgi:hypothetical protein